MSIVGLSLEIETHVTTATDVPVAIPTKFGGHSNADAPSVPGLSVAGDLTGPGIDTPVTLTTIPGQPIALPALHRPGEYTLQNVRLLGPSGDFVRQAVPAFVSVTVVDVMTTKVSVRQLTPDDLRRRGITVDATNYEAYEFDFVFTVEGKEVVVPYPVLVSRITHEVITPPAPAEYPLPTPVAGGPPPRFEPPSTYPFSLADVPEDVEGVAPGTVVEKDRARAPVSIPAAIVIPSGFGVLHQFFAVVLQIGNAAPAGSEIRLGSITAVLDAPLSLRVAKTLPAATLGRGVPIFDSATGASLLVAGAQGSGEWTLEALKSGTHTIDIEVDATYVAPGQQPVALRGHVSSSIAVSDPRFHITFAHPDTVRASEAYTAYAFVTNLSSQSQTVHLDTTAITDCAAGYTSGVCRTSGSGTTDLTIGPGDMATVPYNLKAEIDGHVMASAGSASDAAVGVDVKLTMGVSASGIPLSPVTLVMPHYARYMSPSLVDAERSLLGLGYSLATAPMNATTARFPRLFRTDVFRRAQDMALAGQRIFASRADAAVLEPAKESPALFNLALDLLDNTERMDRVESTAELREWDQLRRSEANGRRAAVALMREIERTALAGGRTIRQLADDFAASTAHRTPFLAAFVSGTTVAGKQRPYALSLRARTSGTALDVPSESAEGWVRTLPFGEIDAITSSSESGEVAIVGRWKEDLELSITPQADHFSVDLIFPSDAGMLRASIDVTAARVGMPVTIALSRGNRNIVVSGASAVPLVSTITPAPLHVIGAAQDLHLDPGGHVVSIRLNRPASAADVEHLRDAFALRTAVAAASYDETKRNSATSIVVPGASLQADATIVNVSFDKALSKNATYAITSGGLTDPLTGTSVPPETFVPRIDNDRRGGIVAGRLLRGDGSEVEGSDVQLVSGGTYQYDTTLGHGRFLFEFVPRDLDRGDSGNYVLSARSGGAYTEARGTVRLAGVVQLVDVVFTGRGTAQGRVQYADGSPVPGANVVIGSPVFHEFRKAAADASGGYSIGDLPIGPLTFAATDQSGRSVLASNEIATPGEVVNQDLVIQRKDVPAPARVHVTVKRSDATGAAAFVAHAHVGVYTRGIGLRDGYTGSNGEIVFDGVPSGLVSILASQFDLTRESAAVEREVLPDTTVDQTLVLHVPSSAEAASAAVVEGTVTRDDPAAPNDASRDAAAAAAIVTIAGLASVTADQQGNYTVPDVPLAASGRTVEVFDPATDRRATFTLNTLAAGSNRFSMRLRSAVPAGTGTLRVRLFGARGEVVTGYRVLSAYVPPVEFTETSPGVYELRDVPVPQRREVWAVPKTHGGAYGEQLAHGSVSVELNGQTGVTDLRLPGEGSVEVRIEVAQTCATPPCYATAPGRVNVRYAVWDEAEQSPVAADHFIDADASGATTALKVPAGERIYVETVANPAGFANGTTSLGFDGDKKTVTLRLEMLSSVSGRVLSFDGTMPIAGSSIRFSGSVANPLPVTTAADGTFRFGGIAADQSFRITAEWTSNGIFRTGYIDGRTPKSGGPVDALTIVLREQSSVDGTIVGHDAHPVPLARYWARELTWPYRTLGSPASPRLADASGRFTIDNVFAGPYSVTAVAAANDDDRGDYQGEIRFEGDTSQHGVVIAIGAGGRGAIAVEAVNPQNGFERVPNVELVLVRDGTPFDFITTDANGLAIFDSLPASGKFQVRGTSKSLGRTGTSAEVTLANGETARAVVTLEFRGRVSGSVHDPESIPAEKPVSAVPVTLRSSTGVSLVATTDTNGSFDFVGVPEGTYAVEARDPESGRVTRPFTATISALYPERLGIAIELERTARLNVRAFLPDDTGGEGALAPLVAVTVQQGNDYMRALQGNDLTFARMFAQRSFAVTVKEIGGEGREVSRMGGFADGSFESSMRVVFPTSGTVTVAVRDASGAAVADARLTVSGGGRSATVDTPSNGTVALQGFPLGTITAQVQKGSVAASGAGTLLSRSTPLAMTLQLGGTVSIVGAVDAESGGASVGTRVELRVTSALLPGGLTLQTTTDAAGAFRFEAIPVNSTAVTISCFAGDGTTRGAMVSGSIADGTAGVVDFGHLKLDATSPRVLSIDPPSNANSVSPDSAIVIAFSEPIASRFLTTDYFQLIGMDDGLVIRAAAVIPQGGGGGSFVVRIIAPDPTPAQIAAGQKYRLRSNVTYRVVVTSAVEDAAGNAMNSTVGTSFTTTNYTEPSVVGIDPPVSRPLPQQATLRITFNKAVDAAAFAEGGPAILRIDQIDRLGGAVVATIPSTSYADPADPSVMVLAPRVAIAESSIYRITVSGGRDLQIPPRVQAVPRTFEYFSFDTHKPVISINSPVPEGVKLVTGTAYVITPSITEEGTQTSSADIASVDWFDANGKFMTRMKTEPFAITVVAPAAQQLTLKAVATDLSGNGSATATRSWEVAPNQPPGDVRITTDVTSAYAGRPVKAEVAFADEGTTVTVALKVSGTGRDGQPLAVDLASAKVVRASVASVWTTAKLSFNVPDTLRDGTATLTATVTDSMSAATTATTALEILRDVNAPAIATLTPRAETHFTEGETLVVTLTASDPETGVSRAVLTIGAAAPLTISAGSAGSAFDALSGVWTFTTSIVVPRRNADTRVHITADVIDRAENVAAAATDVVYDRVNDPAVPDATWITPADGAALPRSQSSWSTLLRVRAKGNVTDVTFSSTSFPNVVVKSPAAGTTDVYEARVTIAMPSEPFGITATVRDGIDAHTVELPITIDPITPDVQVISADLAITASTALSYAGKTLLVRGPAARLYVHAPVALKNLILLDGAVLSGPDTHPIDLTIADRLFVDATSLVDGNEKGYTGGWGTRDDSTRNDSARGLTAGGSPDGASGAASHSGIGGETSAAPTNATYGTIQLPTDAGAGGGGTSQCCIAGGAGGGLIRLHGGTAGDLSRLVICGTVRADGGPGVGRAWPGAGGGIAIDARALIAGAAARITASGGDDEASPTETRGGGGGRIAVAVSERLDLPKLAPILSARGGRNGDSVEGSMYTDGGAGTIFVKSPNAIDGGLIVSALDERHVDTSHATRATPLAGALAFDSLTIGPRALARFDADYTLRDPAALVVDPTATLLTPRDVPVAAITSSTPAAGSTVIQGAKINAVVDAAAIDGIESLRARLGGVDVVEVAFPEHPKTITARPIEVTVPSTSIPGAAPLTMVARTRAGRMSETQPATFTVVANTAPVITKFEVTPVETYAGHDVAVAVSGADDLAVSSISLTASAGALVASPIELDAATRSASRRFMLSLPPTLAAGTVVQVVASISDDFPGRAPVDDSRSISITRDAIAPVVTVSLPHGGDTVQEGSGNTFAVEASAADNETGVMRVTATVDGNAVDLVPAAGRPGVYTGAVPVPEVDGSTPVAKVVSVTALDHAGNAGEAHVTINVQPLNDPLAPALSWICGSAGAIYPSGATVKLRVLATPSSSVNGVSSVEFRIGSPAVINPALAVSGVPNAWEANVPLPSLADGSTVIVRAVARSVGGNVSESSTSVRLYSGAMITQPATISAADTTYNSSSTLFISGTTVTIAGHHEFARLVLLGGAVLTHPATTPSAIQRVDVAAGEIYVSCDSSIDVSARGFAGTVGGRGYTYYDANSASTLGGSSNNAGGSHGGRGGQNDTLGDSAITYDSLFDPNFPGGAGGYVNGAQNSCGSCGAGGGVVRLSATAMVLDGSILANGIKNDPVSGAGGAVRVVAGTLAGAGEIHADGSVGWVASSGGGRVSLEYQTFALDKLRISAAAGSVNSCCPVRRGTAGTIYLRQVDAAGKKVADELIVDNGTAVTAKRNTDLGGIGTGTVISVSGSTVTLSAPVPEFVEGSWIEFLDGSRNVTAAYSIVSRTATTVTLAASEPLAISAGTSYRGTWRFDRVRIRNNGSLTVESLRTGSVEASPTGLLNVTALAGDSLTVRGWVNVRGRVDATTLTLDGGAKLDVDGTVAAGTLAIRNSSSLMPIATTAAAVTRLNVVASSLSVDATSAIDATGRGYAGNVNGYGITYGGDPSRGTSTGGSYNYSGGSHGGRGGSNDSSGDSGAVYDSLFDPFLPGGAGAGASNCSTCSPGGGVIRIAATDFVLEGSVTANGRGPTEDVGAAGGAIRIDAGTLSGGGQIHADGGARGQTGGGGRVAIYYGTMSLDRAKITAAAGVYSNSCCPVRQGSAGTVFLKQVDQANGELIVDNKSGLFARATPLPAIGSGTITSVSSSTGGATDRMTDSAAHFMAPNLLAGLRVFVGGIKTTSWPVKANDTTTLTLDVTTSPFTGIAGDAYRGLLRLDKLRLRNQSITSLDVIDATEIDKDSISLLPANAFVPGTSTLALVRPPAVASVALTGSVLVEGVPSVATVTLTQPATPGGAAVALSSSDPSAVAVPAFVIVPEGSTSASFVVTPARPTGDGVVTITATYADTASVAIRVGNAQ